MADDKSPEIHRLLDSLATSHGPETFPVEDWRLDSPTMVTLTSARDRRFAASIVALPYEPVRYSVIIELYDPPEPQIIPFEIAADGEFSLSEAVELFARYREWSRKGM